LNKLKRESFGEMRILICTIEYLGSPQIYEHTFLKIDNLAYYHRSCGVLAIFNNGWAVLNLDGQFERQFVRRHLKQSLFVPNDSCITGYAEISGKVRLVNQREPQVAVCSAVGVSCLDIRQEKSERIQYFYISQEARLNKA
jgi:hypothetical protein